MDCTSSFLDAEVWRCCASDVARFLNEQVLQLDLIVYRNMMTATGSCEYLLKKWTPNWLNLRNYRRDTIIENAIGSGSVGAGNCLRDIGQPK